MNTKSFRGHAATIAGAASRSLVLAGMAIAMVAATVLATPLSAQDETADEVTYSNIDQRDVASFVDAGVSIAQAYDPETTSTVVLATDANFPDALAASAVAGAVGGPVLFTSPSALSQPTADEIARLLVDGDIIYVMGGTEAVSDAVVAELSAYDVRRLAGDTRIETAVAAAELVGLPSNGTVIVARAFGPDGANTPSDRTTGWVDAVSCGAFAAANQIPIYLTQTSQLSASAATSLQASGATDAIVCGGPVAVSDQALEDLRGLGINPTRVAGPTRIETAIATATDLFGVTSAQGQSFTIINGYGEQYGYGLAAAPLGNPILLVGKDEPTSCVDERQPSRGTLCFLQSANEENPALLLVVGDDSIISPDVVAAVSQFSGGVEEAAPEEFDELDIPDDVTAVDDLDDDGTRLTVAWDAVADPDDILVGYNVYVDGQRRGSVPTVGPEVTTLQLTGLAKDAEVSITVTSLDDAERESEPSDPATATPEDEVPAAITGFTAKAGDTRVVLDWDAGPLDFKNYVIQRAQAGINGACPTDGFATIQTITDRNVTEFADTGRTNGTALCYRITTTDTADQTSPAAAAGPVTPAVGVPQVQVNYPTDGGTGFGATPDVVNFGKDLVVRYRVTDTDTDFANLRVSVDLSYNGDTRGAYRNLATNVAPTADTAGQPGDATFVIRVCNEGDVTSLDCVRDQDISTVRVLVSVSDGAGGSNADSGGDFDVTRRPPPVGALSAIGVAGGINLAWTAPGVTKGRISGYRVLRAQTTVPPDSDASVESCPNSGYTEQAVVSDTKFSQSGLSPGTSVGGTPVLANLYCYRVTAIRLLPDNSTLDSVAILAAAIPLASAGVSASLTTPTNGRTLEIGRNETISYTLQIPAGSQPPTVQLFYCVDYGMAMFSNENTCLTGYVEITTANGLNTAPTANNGSNSLTWRVPAATAQDSEDRGAVELRASGANPSRAINILFRGNAS